MIENRGECLLAGLSEPQLWRRFAAFGSFAMLVLVEFTGRPRSRLTAYLTLGLVGAGRLAGDRARGRENDRFGGTILLLACSILVAAFYLAGER